MTVSTCCFPELPFAVLGAAVYDDAPNKCETLEWLNSRPSPPCLGCGTLLQPDACAAACHARSECHFYQFEPLVEYYLDFASSIPHQCAFICDAQGLTRRSCSCGRCALFSDASSPKPNKKEGHLRCSDSPSNFPPQCGLSGPSTCLPRPKNVSVTIGSEAFALSTTRSAFASHLEDTTSKTTAGALPSKTVDDAEGNSHAGILVAFGLFVSVMIGLALFVVVVSSTPPPNDKDPNAYAYVDPHLMTDV